jgi:hypothetical protein
MVPSVCHIGAGLQRLARLGQSSLDDPLPTHLPSSLPLARQVNSQRLADLGMGEVSPEAPPLRRKGQHYTREGMGGLMNKVGLGSRGAPACLPVSGCGARQGSKISSAGGAYIR